MAPQQKSTVADQEREIDALLKRLHSGCRLINVSNIFRTAAQPDEVHFELGRALAHSYIASSLDNDLGGRILISLCCGEDIEGSNNKQLMDKANYASTANAFFLYLAEYFRAKNNADNISDIHEREKIRIKWLQWCVRCEELVPLADEGSSIHNGGGRSVLIACLKNYSSICFSHSSSSSSGCDSVYKALQRSSSRKCWIRFIASALESAITTLGVASEETSSLFQNYHPLFEECVLRARGKIPHHDLHKEERRLILNELLRICIIALHKDGSICRFTMQVIEYLTVSLVSYLNQLVHVADNSHESVEMLELSYEWLRGLSDMITSASTKILDEHASKALITSIDTIIFEIFPQLSSYTSSFSVSFELTSIYTTIASSVNALEQYSNFTTANVVGAMKLGTLALSLKSDRELNGVCGLLLSIFSCFTYDDTPVYSDVAFVGGILYSLGCVFSPRPSCANKSLLMRQIGMKLIQRTSANLDSSISSSCCLVRGNKSERIHLMDLFVDFKLSELPSTDYQQLIELVSKSISDTEQVQLHWWRRRPLALEDQCSGLLLGLTLLHMSVMSPSLSENGFQCALGFLASFLECFPRAASRVLPSVLDTVRMSIHESSPSPHILHFLVKFIASKSIISDPHGAHLAWTFLSPLTNDSVPTATRASIIRILPQMCLNNKRLLRRIRNVIGRAMVSTDPMVRVAATATLSEMAKMDLLLDVEGIISWIQGRLKDDESTVTYFALLTLRYLVQNGELDFDLVVRVLEKRLAIDLSAVNAFVELDVLTLESLVEFLGEGGLEGEGQSSDEEDDEGGAKPTAKTVIAVSLLIELALKINADEQYPISTKTRVLGKIYMCLSSYSTLILGLDSESIRSCAESSNNIPEGLSADWERFLQLKFIVQCGLDVIALQQDETKDDGIDSAMTEFSTNLVAMIQLLLSWEDETFGSFLLRKGNLLSKGKHEGAHQRRVSKSVLSALPKTSTIKSMFESEESASARAAAYLYALGVEDDNPQSSALLAEMTECIAHFSPPDDPAAYAVQIFSIINAMAAVFRSVQNGEENTQEKLFEAAVDHVQEWATEFSEFGFVALAALALSADDSPQFFSGILRVQNTILDGGDMFETEDVKLLCLCIVAARLSRTTDARAVELIDTVEKSVELHAGQTCFGGYLGLAIFVQSVSNKMRLTGSDPSEVWCREQALRCISFLVKALSSCLLTEDDTILDLASRIQTSKSTCTLPLTSELMVTVKDGAAPKLKGVIIGLSHCFPALAGVSTDLLKGVVAVIDELPWGSSGKGFVTHSAFKCLMEAGVYSPDDLSEAIATSYAQLEDFHSDCVELSDVLFSCVTLCHLSSGNVKEELDFINDRIDRILSATSRMSSKGKSMTIFTCCASVGDIPGVTSFAPKIHSSVNKVQVTKALNILEKTLSSGELECMHAAALALGVLCGMRNSSHTIFQHKNDNKSQSKNVDVNSIIQGKDGSVMDFVLQQVAKAHSVILVHDSEPTDKINAAKKLCILFKTLEAVALPGSFSRVIETTLYSTAIDDLELTDSSLKLLFSQIESGRRRIGFDGRGFLDLSTRLIKLPLADQRKLIGATGFQMMMAALPSLLFQLPTSACEEVVECLWCISRDLSHHPSVMAEFFDGMKTVFASAEKVTKEKSKISTSPALLRTLQNFVASGIFSEFCDVIAQSSKNDASSLSSSSSSYSTIIAAYLECLNVISASAVTDAIGIQSDISYDNVLVMALSASLSSKQTRRVETWIARHQIVSDDESSNLRMLLLSSLAVAPQTRDDIEMKDSIVNLFDIMLVMGANTTLCIELIAAKVAYWWDSRNMNEALAAMHPIHRVSTMSSFLVSSNLCFEAQSLPNKEISRIFDLFVTDLPTKLALLCKKWKISDDISNRATRLCSDATGTKKMCLERTIELLEGGRGE